MLEIKIVCGCESPAMREDQAHLAVLRLAAQYFPNGHTVTVGHGRWMSPERGLVSEKTVIVSVLAGDRKDPIFSTAYEFAGAYKAEAQQDAVIVQLQEIEYDFV